VATEDEARDVELQRRLEILRDQFKSGKIKISKDVDIKSSLLAIRYGSDGKVDLGTVDAKVRALALAVAAMHDREELKKDIPLREIQETYFTYIERNFGQYHKVMLDRGLTPQDAGIALSRRAENVKTITAIIPDFVSTICEFWEHAEESAWTHLEDMQCLKGVFGGDLFPTHDENLASKCGIYTDTLIIPDPFVRSRELFERWPDEKKAYYLIKHSMSLLNYKQLALAEVEPPIVVVLPDPTKRSEREQQFMLELGKRDSLGHAGAMFGRAFDSFEALLEYLNSLDTSDKVLQSIRKPELLLFDAAWERSPKSQLENVLKGDAAELLPGAHPGQVVASQILGRMAQANDLLLRSRRFRGVPIIDAPTSWQYFVWKLAQDAAQMQSSEGEDVHVLRGLQHAVESEMQWLGRIPPSALIELRKEGALAEIRELIGRGVRDLAQANPQNFHRSADQVVANLQDGFADHQRKLEQLRNKKWRFAGVDIGSWLAVGTLEVSAAATGTPLFGISALVANQVLDVPKLKDIPSNLMRLVEEDRKTRCSPVGLLFQYRDRT
jgi:hypothetical protein